MVLARHCRLADVAFSQCSEASADQCYLELPRALASVDIRRCPYCGSPDQGRWGFFAGRARYRCRKCLRTFTLLTGSPQANLKRPELWPGHLDCMQRGLSLRRCAAELGIHVSTAFRWRHRIIKALPAEPSRPLAGVVQLAEHFYPFCRKGERFLDRPPKVRGAGAWNPSERIHVIIAWGEIGGGFLRSTGVGVPGPGFLRSALGTLINRATAVHTVKSPWYIHFCRCLRLPHRRAMAGEEDAVLSRVWPARRRLRRWLAGFRGVAARYLGRYLAWFAAREGFRQEG